jgi:hypothetical protein
MCTIFGWNLERWLRTFLDDDDFVAKLFEEGLEDVTASFLVALITEVRFYPLPLRWVKAFEDGLIEGRYALVALRFAGGWVLAVSVAKVNGLFLEALHLTEVEIKGFVEGFEVLLGQVGTRGRAALGSAGNGEAANEQEGEKNTSNHDGMGFDFAVTEVLAMMKIRGRDGPTGEIPHDAGYFF